jgi:hypothetical protein
MCGAAGSTGGWGGGRDVRRQIEPALGERRDHSR